MTSSKSETAKSGFALLIVVTLLAFLVMILVALSSLTRVETQVASNAQSLAQARQNTLLALNIAIGQLQKYAGPDNVTTARADILASTPANSANFGAYYTGVWGPTPPIPTTDPNGNNVRPPSPLVTWLVSGNEIDPLSRTPADATSADDVVLLNKEVNELPDLRVRVRKQSTRSTSVPGGGGTDTIIGHYAWWVGDEGVKAKLNLTDPYASWTASASAPSMPGHTPDAGTETRYRLLAAQRFGIEKIGTDLAGNSPLGAVYDVADGAQADFRRDMEKLLEYRQLNYLHGFAPLTGTNDLRAHRFHDLTVSSHGVLTNSDVGGLREDLTWHFENWTSSPLQGSRINLRYPDNQNAFSIMHSWELLRKYYKLADEPRPLEVRAPVPNVYFLNDLTNAFESTPAPVLVQFRVFFTPSSDGRIKMRLAFVVANPYNSDLRLTDGLSFTFGRDSNNSGSSVTVTSGQAPALPAQPALNILDHLVSGGPTPTTATSVPYVYAVPGAVTFAAGEARVFTLAADVNFPASSGKIALTDGMNTASGIYLTGTWTSFDPAKLRFADVYPDPLKPSRFSLKMWKGQGTSSTVRPLQYHTNQAWTVTGETGPGGGGIGIRISAPADTVPGGNQARPLFFDLNFRSAIQTSNDATSSATLLSPVTWASYWLNDEFATDLALGIVPWGNSNSLALGKTRVVLYDVPRRGANKEAALMSLAEFRHIDIGRSSSNIAAAIGNSRLAFNTNNLNSGATSDISFLYNEALWDRFYFSTIPQTAGEFSPVAARLPNARYAVKSTTPLSQVTQAMLTADSHSAARHLMINGPFNVNSTSVQAWKAFFAGTQGLSLQGEGGNVTYFRTIRQPGKNTSARDFTKDDAWNGYVNLTDPEVTSLATRMVAEVKARGPFNTLGQFVNRRFRKSQTDTTSEVNGALQQAIDNAALNKLPSGVPNNNLYIGIPGFFMQGDMLQSLGPVLTTRSDTFLIRAYGDCVNPVDGSGEPVARAYCEAVVQRMQDPVQTSGAAAAVPGGTPPDYVKPPGAFGRRFVVVRFRWLTPESI